MREVFYSLPHIREVISNSPQMRAIFKQLPLVVIQHAVGIYNM